MTQLTCPAPEVLSKYVMGNLDDVTAAELDLHLESCETCLNALESGTPVDSLFAGLKKVTRSFEEGSAYRNLTSKIISETNVYPTIPGYEIIELIGQGGMGKVYKAMHPKLGKFVAIKFIRGSLDPTAIARFEREIKAVGRLDHPNVVRATDAGEADGVPYLVMEFVQGKDLSRLVKEEGPLPVETAKKYITQLASGLAAAHAAGIIHRDVKPSNAILTADGTVKLLDLGLALLPNAVPDVVARESDTSTVVNHLTQTGRAMGTRDYMAPEQVNDPQRADQRADIYGLGATLWFLLNGQPPTSEALLDVKALDGRIPVGTWRQLLAREPADRFANMSALMQALAVNENHLPSAKTNRRRGILIAAGIIALVAIALFFKFRPNTQPTNAETPDLAQKKVTPEIGKLGLSIADVRKVQSEWSDFLDQPITFENKLGMKFKLIPPGKMNYGTSIVNTQSRALYVGETEVTRGQFRQYQQETNSVTSAEKEGQSLWATPLVQAISATLETYRVKTDSKPNLNWRTPGFDDVSDQHPVVHISYQEAQAFCDWLSKKEGRKYRLPSKLEMLWAARGCDRGNLPEGGETFQDSFRFSWSSMNCEHPQRVAQKQANPWGLFDMCGNVQEWCRDTGGLPTGEHVDGINETPNPKKTRSVYGGGYADRFTMFTHIADLNESKTRSDTGFRVVLELP